MCGIVGLFLKDASLEPQLGAMLTDMLITMTDRGPDSAGIAIYSGAGEGRGKITVQSSHPGRDFANLDADLKDAIGTPHFLSEQEAALAQATMEPLSVRSWEMWKKQAGVAP